MDDCSGVDICRVCRSEGAPERPLFHPCICTGSIKWVHQECLVQWMRYSRKEYCELCSHHFSFTPIYSPDMPHHLPFRDVIGGFLSSIARAIKYWLHYALVALAWLGLVPLLACRISRYLFSGSLDLILTVPYDIISTENILSDIFHGCFVVASTFFASLGMVWLREQIVHGGGPDWLELEQEVQGAQQQQVDQLPENNLPSQEGLIPNPDVTSCNNNSNSNSNASSKNINDITQEANSSHGSCNIDNNGACGSGIISDDNRFSSGESIDAGVNFTNTISENNEGFVPKELETNFSKNDCIIGQNVSGENHYESERYMERESIGLLGSDSFKIRENMKLTDHTDCNRNLESSNTASDDHFVNPNSNYENSSSNSRTHSENLEPDNSFNSDEILEEVESGNEEADRNEVEVEPGVELPEGGENAQNDGNWNPIEWDRQVEELTWERLLGLDGSLIFLEYVLWIICLNILFIAFFVFLPYQLGNLAITGLGLKQKTAATHFEGLITTLCGYCVLGLCLVLLRTLATLLCLQKSKRILGLCYIIVKVSLILVVNIGVLPLICGWWLDICSLSMFHATLKDRETSFRLAPGTSMFLHWLVGIVYSYYFVSFILLLREVVRPGVLWFLKNLYGPDFSTIQEMIHTPIIHYIRRLLVSAVMFGTAVLLMFWVPAIIIRYLWPTFLPYTVELQSEAQINAEHHELSAELLLLQIIVPALLEQSHTRIWIKNMIKWWCKCAAWVFDIHSYLLGDNIDDSGNGEADNNDDNQGLFNGLAVHHQALLPREGPIGVQPYTKPSWFYARLIGLLFAVCVSLVIASLAALTLPVLIGRHIISIWISCIPDLLVALSSASSVGEDTLKRIPELYGAFVGMYFFFWLAQVIVLLRSWLPQGRSAVIDKERLKQWCLWGTKYVIAFSFLLGIIPLLFGIILDLLIVVPARVEIYQTPVLFVWQDWALGVLYMKIVCGVIMLGPDGKMKRAIERVYRDGIRNMDLQFILFDLAIPVTGFFSLALALPYAAAHSIVPHVVSDIETKTIIEKLLYPGEFVVYVMCIMTTFQMRQFQKLYEHIKNDKYLVGKRLVNYDHGSKNSNPL